MSSTATRRFSPRRIKKVQELRDWHARRGELRTKAMHRIERLTRSREGGWLEWRIPPLLEAAILLRKKGTDPASKPGFVCHSTHLFLIVLWKATIERKHSHLFVAYDQMAALLGCSLRTAQNAVYEAQKAGWVEVDPVYDEVHTDGRCRCEHIHASKDAPCTLCPCALHQDTWEVRCRLCRHPHGPEHSGPCSCGCRVFRPLQHRQVPNAYAPGLRLVEVAMHLAERKGDLLAYRHWSALHGAIVQRKKDKAAAQGVVDHDPLDRNECDPSPCEGSLLDLPPPTSPGTVCKLPGTCARAPRRPSTPAAPPAAPVAPVKAPPPAPTAMPPLPAVPAAPVDPTQDRALMAEGPEHARGLSAASRRVVDDARPPASTPAAWPIDGGTAEAGNGAAVGRPTPVSPAPRMTAAARPGPTPRHVDPRHQPLTAAERERIADLPRLSARRLSPHSLRDLAERMDLRESLAENGRPPEEITEELTRLHGSQQAAKWRGGPRLVCVPQPQAQATRMSAAAEVVREVLRLLDGVEGVDVAAARNTLRSGLLTAAVCKEARAFLDCAREQTPSLRTAAALLDEVAWRLATRRHG